MAATAARKVVPTFLELEAVAQADQMEMAATAVRMSPPGPMRAAEADRVVAVQVGTRAFPRAATAGITLLEPVRALVPTELMPQPDLTAEVEAAENIRHTATVQMAVRVQNGMLHMVLAEVEAALLIADI